MNWLKKDAINRLWRTFWQAVGGTILVSVGDVGYQLLDRLLSASAAGAVVDWHEVWSWTERSLVLAVVLPILAYLHRTKLDPSTMPSLTPPLPTPTPAKP